MALSPSLKKHAKAVQNEWIITPRLTAYMKRDTGRLVEPEFLKRINYLLVGKQHRHQGWHPSGLYGCQRAQTFNYLGMPGRDKYGPNTMYIFLDGHWRGIKWQATLLAAGIISATEVRVNNDALRLVGVIDGEGIPYGNVSTPWVYEGKGTAQFEQVVQYGAMPQHIKQVHAYFIAKGDTDTGVIFYEDKTTNRTHECIIREQPKVRKEILEILDDLNTGVENATLPEVLDECKYGEGAYKQCSYAYACKQVQWSEAHSAATACKTADEVVVHLSLNKRNTHEQKPAENGQGRAGSPATVRFAERTGRVPSGAPRKGGMPR